MRWVARVGLCLAAALSLHAREGGRDPGRGINFYSIEREIALGRQLAAELERQVKLADDPILSEYVNRLEQNISRESEVALPVTVRIIESGDWNAFTLPGGHVYVTTAMLRLTDSEAELAFVLAHELGHVAARHGTRQATRTDLAQLGSIPLSVLGGWTGAALRQLAGPSAEAGLRRGSRSFENEADRLGVDFLDRAGYDPEASVDMLERVEGVDRKRPGSIRRLYDTHPLTAARIERTQKHLKEIAGHRDAYKVNTSEYEEMRLRMVKLEARREALERTPALAKSADRR